MNQIELGNRIKNLRESANLTQIELGAIVSESTRPVSSSTVDSWETGFTVPTVHRLIKIASYFEVSLDWLVGYASKAEEENEIEDLTTHHFLEFCEELGYITYDNANSISVFVPGKDNSVKYLIAWINKLEPHNYKLTTLIHPNKDLLNEAVYAYSKTTKGKRGNRHKRIDTRQQDYYYNIK